jgi:hypothetical protein
MSRIIYLLYKPSKKYSSRDTIPLNMTLEAIPSKFRHLFTCSSCIVHILSKMRQDLLAADQSTTQASIT